ncbi:hypothetical protein FB45DRAFT_1004834 [Roridomyces roridus]|uniref:Uncharacterized protein n=1 Tax=Roridomyces roridus TaxID=1738132 RepID=A0AAD7BQ82_9AGAR|nr:hypothetical protein FB45DRAFT_1004834 [Roridomyces roridus]
MPKAATPRRTHSTRSKSRGGAPVAPPLQTRVNVVHEVHYLDVLPTATSVSCHTNCLKPTPSVMITNGLSSLRLEPANAAPDVEVDHDASFKLTSVSPYCTECYIYPMPPRGAPTSSDQLYWPPHVLFVPAGGQHNVLGPGCLEDPHAFVLSEFPGSIGYTLHVNGKDVELPTPTRRIIPGNCEHNPISRIALAWWIARACAEHFKGDVTDMYLVEFKVTQGSAWKAVVVGRTNINATVV